MKRKLTIKQKALETLQKEVGLYELEAESIRKEKEEVKEGEEAPYILKSIEERVQETEKALKVTRNLLSRTKREIAQIEAAAASEEAKSIGKE